MVIEAKTRKVVSLWGKFSLKVVCLLAGCLLSDFEALMVWFGWLHRRIMKRSGSDRFELGMDGVTSRNY